MKQQQKPRRKRLCLRLGATHPTTQRPHHTTPYSSTRPHQASKQHETRRRRGERVAPEEREEATRSIGEVLLLQEDEEEEDVPATAGMKVKVVLTRAELEWLMAQLKSGEQRLEDVLRQMGTARTAADDTKPPSPRADGWRPRLERILECPEALVDAT